MDTKTQYVMIMIVGCILAKGCCMIIPLLPYILQRIFYLFAIIGVIIAMIGLSGFIHINYLINKHGGK